MISSLYTTVKNVSGKSRVFGFLRERGMRLAPNEVVTVRGDLVASLGAKTSARKFKALERALDPQQNGSLQIISTPGVILLDGVSGESQELVLSGGALGIVDPEWAAAGSSSEAA